MPLALHARELLETGVTIIPFYSNKIVPAVISGLRDFSTLPKEVKTAFTINQFGEDEPDLGYIRKNPDEDPQSKDRKVYFHWTPFLPAELAKRGVDFSAQLEWFADCQALFNYGSECMRGITGNLREFVPEMTAFGEAQPLTKLRLLYYDPAPGDTIVAHPHFDRSTLTLHIAESRPGLLVGEEGKHIDLEKNQALVFPGRKAEKMTRGRLKAMWHRAVEIDDFASRWAVVLFYHLHDFSVSR